MMNATARTAAAATPTTDGDNDGSVDHAAAGMVG